MYGKKLINPNEHVHSRGHSAEVWHLNHHMTERYYSNLGFWSNKEITKIKKKCINKFKISYMLGPADTDMFFRVVQTRICLEARNRKT